MFLDHRFQKWTNLYFTSKICWELLLLNSHVLHFYTAIHYLWLQCFSVPLWLQYFTVTLDCSVSLYHLIAVFHCTIWLQCFTVKLLIAVFHYVAWLQCFTMSPDCSVSLCHLIAVFHYVTWLQCFTMSPDCSVLLYHFRLQCLLYLWIVFS